MAGTDSSPSVLTPQALLEHWQRHRRLTRRVIEAFPDDKLFAFSIGSMRPFSAMVLDCIHGAEPIARGLATRKWQRKEVAEPKNKAELLALWDQVTAALNELWPQIPARAFSEAGFGEWEGTEEAFSVESGIDTVLSAIDEEIHDRGQAYVYLRALGITPPAFYDRH